MPPLELTCKLAWLRNALETLFGFAGYPISD